MEGGKDQNYWPGFVDALSNVVLTLVFVLVIFVFALVMASSKVQKQALHMAQQAQEDRENAQIADLQKKLAQALAMLNKAHIEGPKDAAGANKKEIDQLAPKYSKSNGQQAAVESTTGDMILSFAPDAITISPETIQEIENYVKAHQKPGEKLKISIEASDDPGALSASLAREAELGRALNARNVLLDHKVSAQDITVYYTAPHQVNGTYNWIRLHVEK